MKIAIPTINDELCMHFGHCEKFIIFTTNDKNEIISTDKLTPPPHEPGVLPKWLKEEGADIIIAGGMGMRAQDLFTASGVKVYTGAPAGCAQSIAESFLKDELITGDNVCDH